GWDAASVGPYQINVSCVTPVANDNCDSAITVAIPSNTGGSTAGATTESPLPPTCGTTITAAGVWYRVIGNGHSLVATTCNAGTNYDTKLSVYTDGCGVLTC